MNIRFLILFIFSSLIFTQDYSISFDHSENDYIMGNALPNLDRGW